MDKKYIKTSSIDLASTLLTLGYPIDGIHYSGIGETMEFYFADTKEMRDLVQDYQNRKLRIEPNALFWSRKEIITRMKERMRNEANTEKFNKKGN